MRLDALFRLAFASATAHTLTSPHTGNSPAHSSKGRRSDVRRHPPTACKPSVSGTISLPSPGCFSPFPHGTSSLSVADDYLALEDGPPGFLQGFSCPAVLGNSFRERSISLTGLSPPMV